MEDSSIKKKKEEEKIQMKKGEQAQTSGGSASSGAMPEGVKEKTGEVTIPEGSNETEANYPWYYTVGSGYYNAAYPDVIPDEY